MHQAKMLVVDYDGSSVGEALLAAVNAANGPATNPTYVIASADSHSPDEVQEAVFKGKFWGAAYAAANATQALESVLTGTNTSEYNAQDAYILVGDSMQPHSTFYICVCLQQTDETKKAPDIRPSTHLWFWIILKASLMMRSPISFNTRRSLSSPLL